jgi:hypothetical protein
MRKAKLYLGIILISTFLASCSGNIEMTESKTYHLYFADLTLSLPKGWKAEYVGKFDEPIKVLHIKGIIYKKDYSIETISFGIGDSSTGTSEEMVEMYSLDKKEYKQYGDNYIRIRSSDSKINYPLAYLYINENYCLRMAFESLPRNEVTPELAALFRSMKVVLKQNKI